MIMNHVKWIWVNISTYADEPTINTTNRPYNHLRLSITGIPSTLSAAYNMHSSRIMKLFINESLIIYVE